MTLLVVLEAQCILAPRSEFLHPTSIPTSCGSMASDSGGGGGSISLSLVLWSSPSALIKHRSKTLCALTIYLFIDFGLTGLIFTLNISDDEKISQHDILASFGWSSTLDYSRKQNL